MAQVRYDKEGRRLPDTGHGCGCGLCADSNAPRYERRRDPTRSSAEWGSLQRRLVRFVHGLGFGQGREMA
jgi:hypothetical protein